MGKMGTLLSKDCLTGFRCKYKYAKYSFPLLIEYRNTYNIQILFKNSISLLWAF